MYFYACCMFLSSHITLRRKAVNGGRRWLMGRTCCCQNASWHLRFSAAASWNCTRNEQERFTGAQSRLQWTSKWWRGFCHHVIFPEQSVRWQRREAGQRSAWLESNGFCGVWKYFPPLENKCHGVKFMKGRAKANYIASVGATKDGFDRFQSGCLAAINEGSFFNHTPSSAFHYTFKWIVWNVFHCWTSCSFKYKGSYCYSAANQERD